MGRDLRLSFLIKAHGGWLGSFPMVGPLWYLDSRCLVARLDVAKALSEGIGMTRLDIGVYTMIGKWLCLFLSD